MKNYVLGAAFALVVLVLPTVTNAASLTSSQVQSIIALLSSFGADSATIANVNAALTGTTSGAGGNSFCHTFSTDITVGSAGDDVSALNQALSFSGIDTTGNGSSFTENSAADVVSFQGKYGIRQTGYVGQLTRSKLNALYACQPHIVRAPILPTITVTYPNGGEVLNVANPINITWNSTNNLGTYATHLVIALRDSSGKTVRPITSSATTAGNGNFSWTPDANIPTGNYKIWVAADQDVADTSDGYFQIVNPSALAPTITSFSINGYSEVINGTVYAVNMTNPTVQWSSSNAAYCKGTSANLTTGVPTTDFAGTLPASGSFQLMIGDSYFNQRSITLTCYSSSGVPSDAKQATIGGKG